MYEISFIFRPGDYDEEFHRLDAEIDEDHELLHVVADDQLLALDDGWAYLPTGSAPLVVAGDGRPLRGRVAYMAQRDLLLPWLSVLDNVLLGRRLRRETIDAAVKGRAAALLAAVGLSEAAGLRPDALSGGMRQRAALARTLFEDRPVVLMDEPFSAVDAITRVRLQDLAADLLRGRTVLLVTHDPLEALRLGQRIFVMAGRPATLGEPLEPAGLAPRPVDDERVLALQGELLRRLAAAHS